MVAIPLSSRAFGITGRLVECAAMVASSIGGSAYLYFAVVAFARFSQHLFLHLLVCSRSLAVSGLPRNHYALRQRDRSAGPTNKSLATVARAWNHIAAGRSTVPAYLTAKPDVFQR